MIELGFNEAAFRLGTFITILLIMVGLEAVLPRRKRRHTRVRRWFTNFGILFSSYATVYFVTLALAHLFVPITAVISAYYAQQNGWGLFNWLDWPVWIEWPIAFLVLDFIIWGQHVVTHKVPILWRLHRVHHADHDIDASTAIRFHPLEILFSVFVKSFFVILLGAPIVLVVVFEAFVNGSAIFNHANFKLPLWLDRILRPIIVTPDMHRVHHSVEVEETNSNYGFALSIWDRLFGTYIPQPKAGHDDMIIGLNQYQDPGPDQLLWSLKLPFARSSKRKAEAKSTTPDA